MGPRMNDVYITSTSDETIDEYIANHYLAYIDSIRRQFMETYYSENDDDVFLLQNIYMLQELCFQYLHTILLFMIFLSCLVCFMNSQRHEYYNIVNRSNENHENHENHDDHDDHIGLLDDENHNEKSISV
tara:strand:- start:54 stop:443 length:390 start_codon:yes stop_codon:yes gene_type:complete